MGKPAANPLPVHLEGRATLRGPVAGAYVVIPLGPVRAVTGSVTDTLVASIALPFDLRLEEIGVSNTSSAGGASRGTVQVGTFAGSSYLSGVVTLVGGGSAQRIQAVGSTPTLVAAQRYLAAGTRMAVTLTAPASEVVTDLMVALCGYARGHVYLDPAND